MKEKDFKYIYGPVSSWRLGSSLGIDLLSCKEKICTFDCIYCQIGKTYRYENERKVYVPAEKIIEEIRSLYGSTPKKGRKFRVDYITFSGRGEPTLAGNLGEAVKEIRKLLNDKIAVITNSSLMHRDDVRSDLLLTDLVMAKLDAYSQKSLEEINRPMDGITLDTIIEGIKKFRSEYKGKLALQIMFMDENKENAKELLKKAVKVGADEIQINTPLRPSGAEPLSRKEINVIKGCFKGLKNVSVYDIERKKIKPINKMDTLKRRGKESL